MPNKIQILSDFLANQIAAGEVVQRPESVVKELVENAIDAGADTVAVFIGDAGKSLIHVIDNGSGMAKEDLLLAPVRHATSKLHSQNDLAEIKTFGFRGEAMPSIASVALLEIRTAEASADTNKTKHGWKLIAEPMKEFQIEKIAMEKGTQVFVRNLFYNVPARRKFLKSNTTEQKYIHETVLKFALAHPNIRFVFYDNDKLIFDAKPQTLKERIETLLIAKGYAMPATEDSPQLLPVDYSVNDIHIHGYVGHPQTARKTNYIQYFFLNTRFINSKNMAYSVFMAFEHLINNKTFKPFFVLNIDLDYKSVDVNVHPQKSEVKFEDEKLIFSAVKRAVQQALELHNFLPELTYNTPINIPVHDYNSIIANKQPLQHAAIPTVTHHAQTNNFHTPKIDRQFPPAYQNIASDKLQHSIDLLYGNKENLSQTTSPAVAPLGSETSLNWNEININNLWQLHNKYILIQTQTGLLAIDQHNAHERTIYERLVATTKAATPAKQNLLFPLKCAVSSLQLITIRSLETELNNMGFDFEIVDTNEIRSVNILAQPCDISIDATADAFLEIIDDYISNEELKQLSKQDRLCAGVACKAAIKAGQKLSDTEMQSLISNFLQCKMQYVCPHGRPIIVFFPLADWDKKFGRSPTGLPHANSPYASSLSDNLTL